MFGATTLYAHGLLSENRLACARLVVFARSYTGQYSDEQNCYQVQARRFKAGAGA